MFKNKQGKKGKKMRENQKCVNKDLNFMKY